MPSRIYLDHNATSPMPKAVSRAMVGCCEQVWGNPGSAHAEGARAKRAVEIARARVADLLGVDPQGIIFTSGGTEADNTAIRGMVAMRGAPVLVSAVEHKAVLEPAKVMGQRAPVLPNGRLDADEFARLLRTARPGGVSVMLANNEVGNVYPVGRIVRMARAANPDVLVHTDAVNALGKIDVDLGRLGVDLASVSGHKIGGPKGVGALYVRPGLTIPPMLRGGGQEGGLRSGTLNVPAIVGFGKAAKLAGWRLDQGQMNETARLGRMRDAFERRVLTGLPGTRIVGDPRRRLPNTSCLSFVGAVPEFDPQTFVKALDYVGVAASAGSACSCQDPNPSHVLDAMGVEGGAVRFSFGWNNTATQAKEATRRVVAVGRRETR